MEEKNLTRLLNNLNFCIYHNCAMCSRWNNHLDEDDCREELFNSVVGLIHRLQSENAEQKAEIERLTERLDYFQKSSDYHEGNQKELEAKNAELQKQVDGWVRVHDEQLSAMQILTIENKNLKYSLDTANGYIKKLAESCETNCEKFNGITTKQAVKDTAKKIFTGIKESFVFAYIGASEDYEKGYNDALADYDKQLRDFAKEEYDVEVE